MNGFASASVPPVRPLWTDRYLTDGQIVVHRRPVPGRRQGHRTSAVQRLVGWWHRRELWQQVLLVFFGGPMASGPFRAVSEDLQGGIGASLWLLGAVAIVAGRSGRRPPPPARPARRSPEEMLASADTTEARVAGAAGRAWQETVAEPAWSSPFLAHSRAGFDGWAEVDQIVDLALRIFRTRLRLGARPPGPAGEYWQRQHEALEQAAAQLGERADALIRYRDQAAQLSAELAHLADLERLESTALEIQDLTRQTAAATAPGPGMSTVGDEISGVRAAMTELVDLMTRTLTPLASPPPQPPDLPR